MAATSVCPVVWDNPINQGLAVYLLSRAGVFVRVAHDGQEALDVLARERFNAVLMGARPAAPRIDTRCSVANTGGNGVLFRRMLGLIRAGASERGAPKSAG